MPSFNNGSIEVQISGGYAPYTYTLYKLNASNNYVQVSPSAYTNFTNPIVAQDTSAVRFGNPSDDPTQNIDGAYGIAPGTYKIVVVDGSGECITEQDGIIVNSFEQTNVCLSFEDENNYTISVTDTTSGLNNGRINVDVPDDIGTTPYETPFLAPTSGGSQLSPDSTQYNSAAGIYQYEFRNLSAGGYTFNIEDAETCSFSSGVRTIGSSAAACATFNANITGTTVSTPSAPTSSGGTNGSFSVTVPLSTIGFAANEITVSVSGSATATYLTGSIWSVTAPAGTYQVTITSNNGCTYTLPSNVTIPAFVDACAPFISANITAVVQQHEQVLGAADGVIRVIVPTLGTGFSNTAVNITATSPGQSEVTADPISNGNYDLTGLAAGTWTLSAVAPNPDAVGTLCEKPNFATVTIDPGAAAAVPLYYFHGGSTAWPYAQPDLTDSSATYFIPDGSINGQTYQSGNFNQAMALIMDNAIAGTAIPSPVAYDGDYTVQKIELTAGATAATLATTNVSFPAIADTDLYYMITPVSFGDLTGRVTANGFTATLVSKQFTYDGETYNLWKVASFNASAGTATATIN
jgi:hypothetical protein